MSDEYIHDPERVDEIIKAYREAKDTGKHGAADKLEQMLLGVTLAHAEKMLPDGTRLDELSDDELIERWIDCQNEGRESVSLPVRRKIGDEVDSRGLYSQVAVEASKEQDSSD
ncbi:hypothetical protein [Halopelagius longus]|uniref:Uncharacterized protein n=1 Tax=Halopelagius longus TaxID=1236180 RepID=A0A1H0Z8I1_9EURY|nr:hypothetical protein [Halopelagius longus]RDI72882.1 hypothetical protein DWB78_14760 [Halopelagius longus]SDQ23708.1 hypothetical protein SAMN05216278_1077 [Halopelagius longus]